MKLLGSLAPLHPNGERGLGVRGEGAMAHQEPSGQGQINTLSLTSRAREFRHSDALRTRECIARWSGLA